MFRAFYFLFIALAAQNVHAQSASATLDSTRINVGSPATLQLRVEMPAGAALQWASLPDTFSGLEVLSRGKIDTARQGNSVVFGQRLQITGFDSGLYKVPALSFGSPNGVIQTEPLSLLVQTLPVDTTKPFQPIKDIIEVPLSLWDYWPYMLAGLALLGIVLFFIFRKKKPTAPKKARPAESPATAALRALAALEKSGLPERGAMGEYFTRLSDVIRHYLEQGFGISALEQPTDDMLRSIRGNDRLKRHHDILRTFFQTADLAKFAKATPSIDDAKESLRVARKFIEETK